MKSSTSLISSRKAVAYVAFNLVLAFVAYDQLRTYTYNLGAALHDANCTEHNKSAHTAQ